MLRHTFAFVAALAFSSSCFAKPVVLSPSGIPIAKIKIPEAKITKASEEPQNCANFTGVWTTTECNMNGEPFDPGLQPGMDVQQHGCRSMSVLSYLGDRRWSSMTFFGADTSEITKYKGANPESDESLARRVTFSEDGSKLSFRATDGYVSSDIMMSTHISEEWWKVSENVMKFRFEFKMLNSFDAEKVSTSVSECTLTKK